MGEFQKRRIEKFETFGKWCYSELGPNNTAECKGAADRLGLLLQDDIEEAKKEFPLKHFNYKQPHNLTLEQYKVRYDQLAHQILEVIQWKLRWFGLADAEQ